ncbi:cytidine deaminase [Cronobacter sakazakii]|nr:cytidine deaminase [Cronobacter sakazakii]PQY12140.1 cytidine deaminase [Cronobacter sakazakii]
MREAKRLQRRGGGVALAERDDATIVQRDATAATLKALGFTNLELVTLA